MKQKVVFFIEKVYLIRTREDATHNSFSFEPKEYTADLKKYRQAIKEKFNVGCVNMIYTEMPEGEVNNK